MCKLHIEQQQMLLGELYHETDVSEAIITKIGMSCSFALKAVGSRQDLVQQQDEALAVQLLRRKFAHLGHSQKAARHADPPSGLHAFQSSSTHPKRLLGWHTGNRPPAHCLSSGYCSNPCEASSANAGALQAENF